MTWSTQAWSALLLSIAVVGCSSAPGSGTDTNTSASPESISRQATPAQHAARGLLAAEPAGWKQATRHLFASGGDLPQALIQAIRRNLAGPGLQIAVATLGKLGDRRAIPILEELLRERSSISADAALALGLLPSPASRELLTKEMHYHGGSALNRTCAAVALLDLGETEHSLTFLRAILLAGTPDGVMLQQEYGLPDRARWAHERILAIDAVGRRFGGETFGLDPDSPWPRLKAAVDRMDEARRKLR